MHATNFQIGFTHTKVNFRFNNFNLSTPAEKKFKMAKQSRRVAE